MLGRYAAISAARAALPALLGDADAASPGIRAIVDNMRDTHGEDGVVALVMSLACPYALHAVGMVDPDTAEETLRLLNLPEYDRQPWTSHAHLIKAFDAALDTYTQATLAAEHDA